MEPMGNYSYKLWLQSCGSFRVRVEAAALQSHIQLFSEKGHVGLFARELQHSRVDWQMVKTNKLSRIWGVV